jgi:hypothetical protein
MRAYCFLKVVKPPSHFGPLLTLLESLNVNVDKSRRRRQRLFYILKARGCSYFFIGYLYGFFFYLLSIPAFDLIQIQPVVMIFRLTHSGTLTLETHQPALPRPLFTFF